MERAIGLARNKHTHPNPTVGAVLVLDGEIVGEGFHEGPGRHHAEVVALLAAGENASGATAYVSLEPCAHHGRTPPCADALIEAGVATVVVGAGDPDTRVAGRGIERLRAAGIEVVTGVMEAEALALDPGYFHHRRTGLPRVTLKLALTLDGSVAAADGTSQWITGEEARADGHRLRAESDAVMVGAGTLLADDPLLTARLDGFAGHQPRPVVVAGSRPLPAEARIWERDPIVIAPGPLDVPGQVIEAPNGQGGVDLTSGLGALAGAGYLDVLAEGGSGLAGSLLRDGLINRGVIYYGGVLAGGAGLGAFDGSFASLAAAHPVTITSVDRLGADIRVVFMPKGS